MKFKCLPSVLFILSVPLIPWGPLFATFFPDWWSRAWAIRNSCSWFKFNHKLIIYTSQDSAGCVLPTSSVVVLQHSHCFALYSGNRLGETLNIIILGFILLYFYFMCVCLCVCKPCVCQCSWRERVLDLLKLEIQAFVSCPCNCCKLNSGILIE